MAPCQLQSYLLTARGVWGQAGPEVVHSFLVSKDLGYSILTLCHPQCVGPLPWACFLTVPKMAAGATELTTPLHSGQTADADHLEHLPSLPPNLVGQN